MRTTALDLVGDHSRPNYEYVRPDYENHWSDNWLAPVPGLWDDGNRQHSEPNLLDLALPFLQGGCDDLQPPSSVPTRNVGFGELDHNPAPEGGCFPFEFKFKLFISFEFKFSAYIYTAPYFV